MDNPQYNEVIIPPETELLFRYLSQLKEQLSKHGHSYTIDKLYDDLQTRAYFMLRIIDELDFCALYPADGEYQSP
jgi:hypothetical protein